MSVLAYILTLATALPPSTGETAIIDPALPDAVRPTVEAAIEAELDPKRGPDNALKTLEAALLQHKNVPEHIIAVRLRSAGVFLRQSFLAEDQFPVPQRYEQALSTFSRLDLTEPGLTSWFERTLDNHPQAKAKLGKKAARRIPVAFLLRGSGLDRKTVQAAFVAGFKKAGFELVPVPAKKARMLVTLTTETPPQTEPGLRAVRLIMGVESLVDGQTKWRHSLFRTVAAKEVKTAVGSGLDWLVRIGGRDLLFRWLGETAFATLLPVEGEPGHRPGHAH